MNRTAPQVVWLRMLALAVAVGCSGCGSHVKVKPVPVIYRAAGVDVAAITPPERQTPQFEMFYATNRVPKGPAKDRRYTNGFDDRLHLGVATLRIGKPGTTWAQVNRASSGGAENLAFAVANVREAGHISGSRGTECPAFTEAIDRQLATSPNRQVNIYVHGFRTKFEWEAEVLGKFFHYSGRRGAMVCFAWPSRQSLLLYGPDVGRGRKSAPLLADLIEMIARDTKAERINLLAYSCGAAVVADALVLLRNRYPDEDAAALSERLRIGNVIFAASDIDLKTFARDQVVRIHDVAKSVVIYISNNDAALGIARLGYGTSRLGRPKAKELSRAELERLAKLTNIQVVDVSDVPGSHAAGGFGGHGYWYANDWIMTDLLVGFRWQIPPDQRGLVHPPGKAKWVFPKDYPKQVTAAVRRLLQAGPSTDESTTRPTSAPLATAGAR